MARRTTRRSSGGRGTGDFLIFLSFVAVLLLGLALALSFTLRALYEAPGVHFTTNAHDIIERVAIALALSIPLFLSYREARLRGRGWFICWIIAVILIIVSYVLAIVWITFPTITVSCNA
jgi:hypothetical protein